MFRRQFNLSHLICVAKNSPSVTPFFSRASTRAKFPALYPKPLSAFDRLPSHVPTISCIVCWINSLNESSCCRTKPFSSKKELMTTHASSYVCTKMHFSPSSVSRSERERASERRLQPIPSPPRSASHASVHIRTTVIPRSFPSIHPSPHLHATRRTRMKIKCERSHPRVVVGCRSPSSSTHPSKCRPSVKAHRRRRIVRT